MRKFRHQSSSMWPQLLGFELWELLGQISLQAQAKCCQRIFWNTCILHQVYTSFRNAEAGECVSDRELYHELRRRIQDSEWGHRQKNLCESIPTFKRMCWFEMEKNQYEKSSKFSRCWTTRHTLSNKNNKENTKMLQKKV